jgi:diguanylate cyclase (GGDEF)-like protein/PAS domain S-box-containing protein
MSQICHLGADLCRPEPQRFSRAATAGSPTIGRMSAEGGSDFVGTGDRQRLCDSFLHEGQFLMVAVRYDGTIAFVSKAVKDILGFDPADLVGTNILDLVHPGDAERAILQLSSAPGGNVLTGIARFQVLQASGGYQELEVLGGPVTDGAESYAGLYARRPLHQLVTEDILALVLKGVSRSELLTKACDLIQWREHGSQVGIAWEDGRGAGCVTTGIAAELAGGDGRRGTPWDTARRSAEDTVQGGIEDLPEDLAATAAAAGMTLFSIERIKWSPLHNPALLTVWTTGGIQTPALHSYGIGSARAMSELILGWTERVEDMSRAAEIDVLTGLANRRAFFAALNEYDKPGAILYCDLDEFKPVNDTYGHAAGDVLLQFVARRIESCVRGNDMVARLGGDEFAVLCDRASVEAANEVAARIHQVLREPFHIEGDEVSVSVSIGIAADDTRVDETVLGLADRALYEAKAGSR